MALPDGRTAAITGGARGTGRAIAEAPVAGGATAPGARPERPLGRNRGPGAQATGPGG